MANESEWTTRVAAWRESGQSAAAFCAGKEYSASTLYYRASQLKGRVGRVQDATVPIARVVRKAAVSLPSVAPIVVHIGSTRLEISAGADRTMLSELLHALADSPLGDRL
jgi:hypothetical protein